MLKLYKLLRQYFDKKYREKYCSIYKSDYKCSSCHQWYSVSKISPNYEEEAENVDFGWRIKCRNCGEDNYWNLDISMLPIACDKNGVPLK